MARKSERLSAGGAAIAMPVHKRTASATATPSEAKRTRTKKATPTKSQYFTGADDDDNEEVEDEDPELGSSDDATSADEDASEFGGEASADNSDALSEPEEEDEDEEDYDSDEDTKRRKKSTSRKSATTTTITTAKGGELWRPGVKTGLGPGTQVIIKKPKARPAGKIPYQDDTIHPNTLLFLQDLKANNDRQWLKNFRQSERDWHSFVEKLTERLTEIDDTVPELPVKDIVFRIYRDIRFSPDKTAYKSYFSAAWSRTGRKGPYAHYYVQVSPNETFVGGGLWHPEAAPTAAMRQDIDRNPQRIKGVLMEDGMRKAFLKGAPKNEAKVVKAFVASNSENALKTKPKGYDADHADIQLLRLRNYTIGRDMSNDEVVGDEGIERIAALLKCMKPFITYLNSVVMPDEAAPEEFEEDDAETGTSDDEEESP